MSMEKAKSIISVNGFTITLEFKDGKHRVLDIYPYLESKVFKPLKENKELYNTVKVDSLGGIEWSNGACLSPETVYLKSKVKGTILDDNFETNYTVGDWFTFGCIVKTIEDIRKDNNGFNEYLLSDGQWVTGKYLTVRSD